MVITNGKGECKMALMDILNKSAEAAMKKMESTQARVDSNVRSELRRRSDEEVRRLAQNGTNARGRELAQQEAERRGISY